MLVMFSHTRQNPKAQKSTARYPTACARSEDDHRCRCATHAPVLFGAGSLAAILAAGSWRAFALASTAFGLAIALLAAAGVHALAAVFATIALGLGVAAAGSQHQCRAAQGGSQHKGFLDHGINTILKDKKTGLCGSPAEMLSVY